MMSTKSSSGDINSIKSQNDSATTPVHSSPVFSVYSYLTLSELKNNTEVLKKETKMLELENLVLEKYLNKVEPSALQFMEDALEPKNRSRILGSISSTFLGLSGNRSRSVTRGRSTVQQSAGALSTLARRNIAGKINLSGRTELTEQYTEEIEKEMVDYKRHCSKERKDLNSAYEEIDLRIKEIEQTLKLFDDTMEEARDPVTKQVPGEALIRFLIGWLKQAELKIERLRLHLSHNMRLYKNLKIQLAQKGELGETIHPIDFEQISIINEELVKQIGLKNSTLLELKKMSAQASLVLSVQQKFLNHQLNELKRLENLLESRQEEMAKIKKDMELVTIEKQKAKASLEEIKYLKGNFAVPKLMDYVENRAQLDDYRKLIKVWTRRRKIQEIELETSRALCKRIVGRSRTKFMTKPKVDSTEELMIDIEKHLARLEYYFKRELSWD